LVLYTGTGPPGPADIAPTVDPSEPRMLSPRTNPTIPDVPSRRTSAGTGRSPNVAPKDGTSDVSTPADRARIRLGPPVVNAISATPIIAAAPTGTTKDRRAHRWAHRPRTAKPPPTKSKARRAFVVSPELRNAWASSSTSSP
jgi:hypothetical protein